jgi:hypothetical protein
MGRTKLTLSVERKIVARAKAFARIHDTSVSRLVESFLRRLDVPGDHAPSVETRRAAGFVAAHWLPTVFYPLELPEQFLARLTPQQEDGGKENAAAP